MNSREAGHHYLDHLTDWLYLMAITDKNLIIGGDFNCVLDNGFNCVLDNQLYYIVNVRKVIMFNKRFSKQFQLIHPYGDLYPNKQE